MRGNLFFMEKITINGYEHVLHPHALQTEETTVSESRRFFEKMNTRRTIRAFDTRPVPEEVIENIIRTAGTAPSGAHKQPWTFCLIEDSKIKKQIRIAAEAEEKESYLNRMSEEWKKDLGPLATNWEKPFLEEAPCLIVVFKQPYGLEKGEKSLHYYVSESVGIACGFLIAAIHQAGLVTVTHTPSPMNFLSKILNRPENEKPYLLLPVGYPKADTYVPALERKPLSKILVRY